MKTVAIASLAGVALAGDANPDHQPAVNAGPQPINYAVPNPVNLVNRCEQQGMIAVTIDEGPGQRTRELLDMLDEAGTGVKVTFHIMTTYLQTNMAMGLFVEEAHRRGHLIGLRYNPPGNFQTMTDEEIIAALAEQSQQIFNVIGFHPRFLRLPAGSVDTRVKAIADGMGFILTGYNLDAMDYVNAATEQSVLATYENAFAPLGGIKGRWISLHHDSEPLQFIVPSIRDAVEYAKNEEGYNFVTLVDCLSAMSGRGAYRTSAGGDIDGPFLTNAGTPTTGVDISTGSTGNTGNTNDNGNYDDVEDSGEGFVPNATSPDTSAASKVVAGMVATVAAVGALLM